MRDCERAMVLSGGETIAPFHDTFVMRRSLIEIDRVQIQVQVITPALG